MTSAKRKSACPEAIANDDLSLLSLYAGFYDNKQRFYNNSPSVLAA